MTPAMELISFWSGIIGDVVSAYTLIENHKAQTLLILLFLSTSILLTFRLFNIKRYIKTTDTVIGDKRIDALNVANITKTVNKSLKIQEAIHFIRINRNNLILSFEYSGYCKHKKGESGFTFSIDSDVNVPFEKLACYGFDLLSDPRKKHKIVPLLMGADGLTKRVRVPFSNHLAMGDQFRVALFCKLPGCIKYGKDYVTATLAFKDNTNIKSFTVKIEFLKDHPRWVRLYDATSGEPRLIKDLKPMRKKGKAVYYEENYKNIESEKAFIYFFER